MADDSGNKTVVAVKTLKKGPTDEDLLDFLAEIQVMQNVGSHPNVVSAAKGGGGGSPAHIRNRTPTPPPPSHKVNLLGVCIDREPMLIMVEYMKDGNLRDFLRNANNGTTAKVGDGCGSLPSCCFALFIHACLARPTTAVLAAACALRGRYLQRHGIPGRLQGLR